MSLRRERSASAEQLWCAYLDSLDDPVTAQRWFYEVRSTDDQAFDADAADLILRGTKTATASLLWELQASAKPLPTVGSLSILEDGPNRAVCIVRTNEVRTVAFRDVDKRFAYDYGEWNRSLKAWRQECWLRFSAVCERLGREPAHDMPLLCERFRVVWPAPSA